MRSRSPFETFSFKREHLIANGYILTFPKICQQLNTCRWSCNTGWFQKISIPIHGWHHCSTPLALKFVNSKMLNPPPCLRNTKIINPHPHPLLEFPISSEPPLALTARISNTSNKSDLEKHTLILYFLKNTYVNVLATAKCTYLTHWSLEAFSMHQPLNTCPFYGI